MSVHELCRLSTNIKNAIVIFEGLSAMNRDSPIPRRRNRFAVAKMSGERLLACVADRDDIPVYIPQPFAIPSRFQLS
jgi:hypothetical protein